VDNKGSIVDAVFYNNLKALKSITHSGDEQTGEREGLDEVIWVSLNRLPENIKMIIFVVAAYSGGSLKDACNGMLHVLEQQKACVVARYPLEQSRFNVDVVATLVRGSQGWSIRIIDEPAVAGRHFMDILEPTLGNVVRQVIPSAGKQKVAFAMEKGSVVALPQSNMLGQVSAGLGWDVSPELGEADLDVSAVFFSKEARVLGAVFFGNTEDFGFAHSGDNLTGEGEGDDEVISADLSSIPDSVQQVFFVVNIYSNSVTFDKVSNAYCRLVDSSGMELARYALREGQGERGLVMARMVREPGARWGFQALGQFCKGRTWKDSVPELQRLVTPQLQSLGSMGGA